jgi:hypothetical protein
MKPAASSRLLSHLYSIALIGVGIRTLLEAWRIYSSHPFAPHYYLEPGGKAALQESELFFALGAAVLGGLCALVGVARWRHLSAHFPATIAVSAVLLFYWPLGPVLAICWFFFVRPRETRFEADSERWLARAYGLLSLFAVFVCFVAGSSMAVLKDPNLEYKLAAFALAAGSLVAGGVLFWVAGIRSPGTSSDRLVFSAT